MVLYTMITDVADKIIRFAGRIPDHDATAGTDIIFSGKTLCPVQDIMSSCSSGEQFIDALVIGFPVLRMERTSVP